MKKNLIKAIVFLAGLYYLLEFLLPAKIGGRDNPLSQCFGTIANALMVLGGMAFYLGPINLLRSETKHLVRLKTGWAESLVFLLAMGVGILATALRNPENPDAKDLMSVTYSALFYGVQLGFYVTSMGMVAFYLVSASHRAFLLNSMESGLMMVSASIVMLGLTPAGDWLNLQMAGLFPAWLNFGTTTQWILNTPNTAVQKAVLFGACGGAFAAAMRNWLSLGKSGD